MISRDAFVGHLKRENAAKDDQILELRQLTQEETKNNNLQSWVANFMANGTALQQKYNQAKIQLWK